ncbi:MAG TPA: S8 family serine peptidase [Streptosporangiaceae bacterium]|nr:S8 family serine peptidase [Streptosporangiaceae bacterium]
MLSHGRLARPAMGAVLCCAAALLLPAGPAGADVIRSNQQWVLSMMDVPAAWQLTQGAGVTVAVLDSGVDGNVSDLTGSVVTGPDYTGVDTSPSDANWGVHGTWMASLIAGHGHDDGLDGVIGIAPQSRILSIRVIPDRTDPHYGAYEREPETRIQQSLADGIRYAVRHGAKVISMSIGYGAPSAVVRSALEAAYARGVVVIASAGNSGGTDTASGDAPSPESFPADYPGVISVAAVDAGGAVASFSSDNLSVQVAAPGVSVPAQGRDGQYWWVSGTSPACALVAGVAALIKSLYPSLAPDLVASALTSTTTNRPARGYDSQVGFGIVDASAALAKAGQLAHEHASAGGVVAATRFGGGPAAIAPDPVGPRGSGPLVMYSLLAAICLALATAGFTRLVTHRARG